MDAAIGLAFRALYYLWRKFRPLPLSDGAKAVLERMQSDTTDNGVFIDSPTLADKGRRLLCLSGSIEIKTTHRVVAELEDKGLVVVVREKIREEARADDYVKLTHFGWRLNPKTRRVDKIG